MKYLLVVGFSCNVYQREPRARLYFNNQLIDEFFIQRHAENKNFINPYKNIKHTVESIPRQKQIEYYQKSLPFLRFYELNINRELRQANIKIDIDNNDNNYTNGFISRNTLLQGRVLSLLPLDKGIHDWFVHQLLYKRNSYRYPWFHKSKINEFFNLIPSAEWQGNNGQKIIHTGSGSQYFDPLNIGGSGSLHCALIKKYGLLMPILSIPDKSYVYRIQTLINNIIYDKYKQYANQRNTD